MTKREEPVADAREVLGELVRRRDPDPGEQEQRGGDARVRRVQAMPVAPTRRARGRGLRADGHGGGEDDRPEVVVGVEQHRDRQRRDVGREEEVDEVDESSQEERPAPLGPRGRELEQELDAVGRQDQSHQGLGPGLFEAQDRVAEHVEKRDRHREPRRAAIRLPFGEHFRCCIAMAQSAPGGEPSKTVCQPGARSIDLATHPASGVAPAQFHGRPCGPGVSFPRPKWRSGLRVPEWPLPPSTWPTRAARRAAGRVAEAPTAGRARRPASGWPGRTRVGRLASARRRAGAGASPRKSPGSGLRCCGGTWTAPTGWPPRSRAGRRRRRRPWRSPGSRPARPAPAPATGPRTDRSRPASRTRCRGGRSGRRPAGSGASCGDRSRRLVVAHGQLLELGPAVDGPLHEPERLEGLEPAVVVEVAELRVPPPAAAREPERLAAVDVRGDALAASARACPCSGRRNGSPRACTRRRCC